MPHPWIAKRTAGFDSSGIRKVFDLAATMTDPINLSIGQPDFPVPDEIKQAAVEAINADKNGYALTQGVPALREKLQSQIDAQYGHSDRKLLVTSGTSGALVLAMLAMVDPGDEVIVFDPYFVMYPALVKMVGGMCVLIDTYPDFRIDLDKVASAITDRTKLILLNTPANPTGVLANEQEVRSLAELAAERNVALLSDEIYRYFCYDTPLISAAQYNPDTIVVDGFSKTYGVTGWRVGWIHGPAELIEKMTMLQQYTFVCAPQPAQWACAAALEVDVSGHVKAYRERRDMLIDGISDLYEVVHPGGAFYVFPKAPQGTGTEFVTRAIANQLLVIPGSIFSSRDTHFRISYAAPESTIERGIEVLKALATGD